MQVVEVAGGTVAGGRQHGRSSQPVLGHRSYPAAPPGGDPRAGVDGEGASHSVLRSNEVQADTHHLLPRRRQRGPVCPRARTRAAGNPRGLHEAGGGLPAGNLIHRCTETTPHSAFLCRQERSGQLRCLLTVNDEHVLLLIRIDAGTMQLRRYRYIR